MLSNGGIEFHAKHANISTMGKAAAKNRKPTKKDGYDVLSVTRDGVSILKVGRATHFTDRQISLSISKVLKGSSTAYSVSGTKR